MKNCVLARKQLKSCYRDLRKTRSLFRNPRSVIIKRKVSKLLKIIDNFVKFYEKYDSNIMLLKENNVNLARAVQNERERAKNLLQEKILAESSYHELLREHVNLKKDLQSLERVILTYDEELKNSMIPNLVKLSDDVTKFKFKNDVIKKVIENKRSGEVNFPKNSVSNGVNFGTNGNQPVSAVNPMIKGCVIQKPTINVRRVSLPHENRTSLFANVDISSPILEESEEPLETVTSRSRKCKNGLRHVINLSNATVGQPVPTIPVPEIDYRNRTEEITGDINLRMEPVVRLSDVTRMLQNSSYRISESEPETPILEKSYSTPVRHQFSPEVSLKRCKTPKTCNHEYQPRDNPLEGCSWMFQEANTNQFDCNPPAQANTPDWNNRTNAESIHDQGDSSVIMRLISPVKRRETAENESFFREPSLPHSDILQANRKESSCYPRISNALLNDSSVEAKLDNAKQENTFLSSTLNSSALLKSTKKRFFSVDSVDNEPINLLGARREFSKSVSAADTQRIEDAPRMSASDLENDNRTSVDINPLLFQNCTTRQKRNRTSPKSNRKMRKDIVSSSFSTDRTKINESESSVGGKFKKSRSKKSSKSNKIKKIEPSNRFSEDSLLNEFPRRKGAKNNERNSIESENRSSHKKNLVSKTCSFRIQDEISIISSSSEESELLNCNGDSNNSSVTISEVTSFSEETNRPTRSTRKKANISYREPSLTRKLRR